MDKIDFAIDDNKCFDELLEEAKEKIKNCPEPVYIQSADIMLFRKFGWSDQKVEEIVATLKFPKKVFDSRNFKSIVSHFFLFYFTGEIDETWTVESTIYSAISLLNVPDKTGGYERIFDEEYMESEEIKPFYDWAGRTNCASLDDIYIFTDLNLFICEIQAILLLWNEKSNWITENQAKLIRLAAFLALTLCRISARNHILLMGAFKSKEYRQHLSNYVGWKMQKAYWSPSAECIRKCYELKDTLNPIFAIVVREWILTLKTDTPNEWKQALLYESLLHGTEGFGIELIKMLETVLGYTERTFQELMEMICVMEPNITKFLDWQVLIHVHKKFLSKDNPQYSFQWARLIDNAYLQECSLDECSFVAATFAAIVEFKVGPITWQATWARIRPELCRRGYILGRMIHEVLMDTGKLFRKLAVNQGIYPT